MTDMIEKMARAMCEANGFDPDGPTQDIYVEGDPHAGKPWAGYRRAARAALSALQEPTDAMVEAGGKALIDSRMSDKMLDHQLNAAFTAMIKAAKGKDL